MSRTEERLRRLFADCLRAAAPLLMACSIPPVPLATDGGADLSIGLDLSGLGAVFCENEFPSIKGVQPALATDYLELRRLDEGGPWTILSNSGTRCATAPDRAACEAALEQVTESKGFASDCGPFYCPVYLVYTRGAEVGTVTSRAQLVELLAPVDREQEAALLARTAYYRIYCERAVRRAADGYEVFGTRTTNSCAPIEETGYLLKVSRVGQVSEIASAVVWREPGCYGRLPEGLREAACAPAGLGAYLSAQAHLEAASVHAFRRLRRDLSRLGAPRDLQHRALRAARDEVRHARLTAALARRRGAASPVPVVDEPPPRSLLDVARENAVEGGVREAFGALLCALQARRARDPEIAAVLAVLAEDELRHAALALDIAAWANPRLDEPGRAAVAAARAAALRALRAELAAEPDPALAAPLGLPPAAQALALLDQAEATFLGSGHEPSEERTSA